MGNNQVYYPISKIGKTRYSSDNNEKPEKFFKPGSLNVNLHVALKSSIGNPFFTSPKS